MPLNHLDSTSSVPVTVVIPCYKSAHTIDRAVASVANQIARPTEVVLVDDYSQDGTLGVLHALQAQYPHGWIKVIPLPENRGPGSARNAGWEAARQPFIAFLDADDAWHPQKIEIQYGWMRTHPEAALTGHACRLVTGKGDEQGKSRHTPGEVVFRSVTPRQFLLSNRFSTPSVMLKRNLPYCFVPDKRHSEDFLLWNEICLDGYPCYRSEAPLAFLFKAEYGEGGLSGDLLKMRRGEVDAYQQLQLSGRVNRPTELFLLFWSFMKYQRRVVIKKFYQVTRMI